MCICTCGKHGCSRGVGASTATPALAVVDFGPVYLVGLLRATYSRATSLLAIVLVTERDQCRVRLTHAHY